MSEPVTLRINEVDYVRKDSISEAPKGPRAVIVVDRGWIFAGDVIREDGYIILDRAVWVFRWDNVGFDGVIANPKHYAVKLKKMTNQVRIPADSEIFNIPVSGDWGL